MPAIGPNAYPFDPTGAAISNKVVNEVHTVTAVNANEYHNVVPNFAPFYRATLSVLNGGTMTPLVEGVDFLFGYKYKEATINTAIPVYGCITLLNKNFAGVLVLDEYQTVGGQWTLTTTQINQILSDKLLNPRITTWEQLGVAPEHFPVIDHLHVDPEELIGMPELVTAVESIGLAIAGIDVDIDYNAINAYADSKVQDSMSPSTTTKAPSVRAVLEALANLQVGVHIGINPPASPVEKQLWWNSAVGRMFIYYNDGDSTQWVETSPGGGGSGTSARIHVGDAPPTTPVENQLWWNSETLQMFIYYADSPTNNVWVEVISSGSQQATVYVGPSAPANPVVNQLWWQSDLGRLFIYYNDGSSTQWVESSPNNSGADGILPVGSIIAGTTDEPGPGFLHCRGQVLSRATFPDLFTAIGTRFNIGGETGTEFRLPNLQGEFLRGFDNDGLVDPGRTLGDKQKATLMATDYNTPSVVGLSYGDGSGENGPVTRTAIGLDTVNLADYDAANIYVRGVAHDAVQAIGSLTDSTVGGTRPTNVSVNYFIKAYSAVQNPGEVNIPSMVDDIAAAGWKLALETTISSAVSEIAFTTFPANTKMIRICFHLLSAVNAQGNFGIQLGHASGYLAANYKGRCHEISLGAVDWGSNKSAIIYQNTATGGDHERGCGLVDLVRLGNSNIWTLNGQMYDDQNGKTHLSMGSVDLAFPIKQLKIFHDDPQDDPNQFDAGSVAIWYL